MNYTYFCPKTAFYLSAGRVSCYFCFGILNFTSNAILTKMYFKWM